MQWQGYDVNDLKQHLLDVGDGYRSERIIDYFVSLSFGR